MRPPLHALALAAALAVGCAGPRRTGPEHAAVSPPSAVAPGDELERELLRRLSELPVEQPVVIDDATVLARAPYFAASGRTCRALTIRGAADAERSRLACREDGDWFFVPQIFRSGAPNSSDASQQP